MSRSPDSPAPPSRSRSPAQRRPPSPRRSPSPRYRSRRSTTPSRSRSPRSRSPPGARGSRSPSPRARDRRRHKRSPSPRGRSASRSRSPPRYRARSPSYRPRSSASRSRSPRYRARSRSRSPEHRRRDDRDRSRDRRDSGYRRQSPLNGARRGRGDGRFNGDRGQGRDAARYDRGLRRPGDLRGQGRESMRSRLTRVPLSSADNGERALDGRKRAASPRRDARPADDQGPDKKRPRGSEEQERGPDDADAAAAKVGAAPGAAAEAPAARERKAPVLGRGGGVYIPPFRLKQMMAEAEKDKSSEQYQKMMWEALKKSLNGIINKVNASNIKEVLPELFRENLIRGKGLLCQQIMKAQAASDSFTPVFAALMAVLNSVKDEHGEVKTIPELLAHRLLSTFKKAYKRNDKPQAKSSLIFLAHLTNQKVIQGILVLEILSFLLEPEHLTEDSVELAIATMKAAGAFLEDNIPEAVQTIFQMFRTVLQEGTVSKKTQYQIEGLMAIRRAGFAEQGFVAVPPELDIANEDGIDERMHQVDFEDKLDIKRNLNVFKFDPDFENVENAWQATRKGLFPDDTDSDEGAEDVDDEEDDEEEEGAPGAPGPSGARQDVNDMTETNLVNLRRTLYLTIMSSMSFEEAGHKLLKLKLPPGTEMELCSIICECCSQEKTFLRYYALLAQRFCYKFVAYSQCFEDCFVRNYKLCHRLETNKLRNLAQLFAHLLGTDAIGWSCLSEVRVTEVDTTSASRIFIKYLFQELAQQLGLRKLDEKLRSPDLADAMRGVFPRDSMANMRFSINFFTAVGLGGITDSLREDLSKAAEQMQIVETQRQLAIGAAADSRRGSGSSSSGSSSSDSDSDSASSSGSDGSR